MNKNILKTTLFCTALTCVHGPALFAKEQFPQLYSFGDSLSDAGNVNLPGHQRLFPAVQPDPTIAPLGGGVWSQAFGAKFGIPVVPSNQPNNPAAFNPGGNNFAWAGSMMTGQRDPNLSPDYNVFPDVPAQVTAYLARNSVNPNAIYSIWAGSNDIYNFLQTASVLQAIGFTGPLPNPSFPGVPVSLNAVTLAPIQNVGVTLSSQLTRLHGLGAKYFLAFNLPDFGRTPLAIGGGLAANATLLVNQQNANIASALGGLPFRVIAFDLRSFSDYILDRPESFGIQSIALPIPGRVNFFANDGLHPSAYVSQLLADAVFSVVQAPLYVGLLGDAALEEIGAYEQLISSSLISAAARSNQGARWTSIVSGGYGYLSRSKENTAMPGYKRHQTNLILGGHYAVTPTVKVGGLVGQSMSLNDFTNNAGSFDMNQTRAVLFVGFENSTFFGRADAQASYVNVPEVRRAVNLGGFLFNTAAETSGHTFAALGEAGMWLHKTKQIHTGPVAQLNFQYGRIKGFTETGSAPGTNLVFWNQKPRSYGGGLGWETRYKTDTYNTWCRVMAMVEGRPSRDIEARVATLSNTSFAMEIPKVKARPWAYVELGLGKAAVEGVQISAGISEFISKNARGNHV